VNSANLVQKLWNYCNVLRDDGMSYGDYVEQLILEDTNWFSSDLQKGLGGLIDRGLVVNKDAKRRRPKNHVDWKKNEYLELVPGPP